MAALSAALLSLAVFHYFFSALRKTNKPKNLRESHSSPFLTCTGHMLSKQVSVCLSFVNRDKNYSSSPQILLVKMPCKLKIALQNDKDEE